MSGNEMIRCDEIQNYIADYSVGILDSRKAKLVEEHLQQCESCARELKVLEGTMLLVESVEEVDPPAGMWNAVYNRIASPDASQDLPLIEKIRSFFAPPARALAAGFAVLILLAVLTFTRISGPEPSVMAGAETSEYVQGHAMFASQDVFADRFGLTSISEAAAFYEEQQIR